MYLYQNLYGRVIVLKKISKNALVILIIAVGAAAVLAAVYFSGKGHYENRFFQGTMINGWDVTDETAEEVKEELQAGILEYKLTISERGGKTEEITGDEIGLVYTDNGEVDAIMDAQDTGLWFTHQGGSEHTVDTAYTFQEDTLKKLVNGLDCFKEENIIRPEDAFISLQQDGFYIIPEVEGNELDADGVYGAVLTAVKTGKTEIDLEKMGFYREPAIRSDNPELVARLDADNLMISGSITYDFVDRQMTVTKEDLISWLVDKGDGSYDLNYDSIAAWVSNMAYETDTFALRHPFVTSYGVEITLEGGGDYGWCIDKEETTDHLYTYLMAGTVATIQPDYLYTAMDRTRYDIGNTYVEVCISTQTLWCYYNGELITTTPVITGNVAAGFSTPSGSVWAIDGKKTDWAFTHFENTYADYWMPFNDECGLHDASWQRPELYVPTTYLTAGSHGCVNTPYEPMEKIYYYMEIGYPVVVYYSVDQVVGPAPTQELIAG